jgi:adenosylhomocysteine nucleosidase
MIAIIGAMTEEVRAVTQRLSEAKTMTIAGHDFWLGHLSDHEVVVFQSGIGLAMAAMSLTLASQHFSLTSVLNIGTAGGLHPNLNVLDVVVADKITYHDFDISAFGNPRSFSSENRYVFYADPFLLDTLQRAIADDRVTVGPLVSGNQFISTQVQLDDIQRHYPEALAVEMEGAAIAHVAKELQLPWLIVRSISDLVVHPHNEMTFDEYLAKASDRSATMVEHFLKFIKKAP